MHVLCKIHVLHQTTENITTYLLMFADKHMPCSPEVSCDMLDVVEKRDHCVTCVLTITGYFVKHRILQQYLNDQENVLKTSHKLH